MQDPRNGNEMKGNSFMELGRNEGGAEGHYSRIVEKDLSAIGEAVTSLTRATVILQTIEDSGVNYLFENVGHHFPRNGIDFREAKRKYEASLVEQALRHAGGNQAKAAKLLKLNPTTLHSIIKRLNIHSGKGLYSNK